MAERQVVVVGGEGAAPEDAGHCEAISLAVQAFSRVFAAERGARVEHLLDGLLSAYVNETLAVFGPEMLRECAGDLRLFAEGLCRRVAN